MHKDAIYYLQPRARRALFAHCGGGQSFILIYTQALPGHGAGAMTVSTMSPQAVGVAEVSSWPTGRPWGREDFTGNTETQQR